MNIDLKQLRELMRAMKQLDIHELEIEAEGERIALRRGPNGHAVTPVAVAPMMAPASMPPPSMPPMSYDRPPPPSASEGDDAGATYITSPFVGTFYRSPSPDRPSFVDVGSDIRPGTVLCIVEAMKLMNEIEAEISGTVLEVLVENGKPVEFGDRLFKIKKS